MPLLINALQESSYYDPTLETSGPLAKRKRFNVTIIKSTSRPIYKTNAVRRTSPRPFYFEYRHPTPLPFSKNYGSRTWFEKYRNEERLKNIRQIIKYLETTINAKVGDMHSKPTTNTQIAFTGLYIEPMLENKDSNKDASSDLQQESSDNINKFKSNHLADPLFNFKPESPGDVNLLADEFLRFSPIPTPSLKDMSKKYPLFRQIPYHKRNCLGNTCEESYQSNTKFPQSFSAIQPTTVTPPVSTTKSFSVMLNLFPFKKEAPTTKQSVDSIYLTTSRPLIQFKRKSNMIRRVYTPYKRPRYLSNLINKANKVEKSKVNDSKDIETGTQMIVHVKMYDSNENLDSKNESNYNEHSTVLSTQINPYTTKAPIELSTSQIEDYHAGSSGYIPVETRSETQPLPKVTTMTSFFDMNTEYPWPAPTEVYQFNARDAKIPDQYLEKQTQTNTQPMEISRRSSGVQNTDGFEQPSTLIVKLKNEFVRTTTERPENKTATVDATTTVWTYVPQINGHYRSINQNSKNVNTWLDSDPENDRKKRLEQSVTGINDYVPKYVEIKRNHTQTSSDDEVTVDEDNANDSNVENRSL